MKYFTNLIVVTIVGYSAVYTIIYSQYSHRYLTHSSGYVSQSVMHLYLCHASHPIGGVKANPLSRPVTPTASPATVTAIKKFSIVSGVCV